MALLPYPLGTFNPSSVIFGNNKFINSLFQIDFRVYRTFNLSFLWQALFSSMLCLKFSSFFNINVFIYCKWIEFSSSLVQEQQVAAATNCFEKKTMENPAKEHENFANWSPDTSISQKEICLYKKQCGFGKGRTKSKSKNEHLQKPHKVWLTLVMMSPNSSLIFNKNNERTKKPCFEINLNRIADYATFFSLETSTLYFNEMCAILVYQYLYFCTHWAFAHAMHRRAITLPKPTTQFCADCVYFLARHNIVRW